VTDAGRQTLGVADAARPPITASAAHVPRASTASLHVSRVVVTEQLRSDGAAMRGILSGVKHRQQRYLHNRVQNSHQLARQPDMTARR
jgi:transposase-like protein